MMAIRHVLVAAAAAAGLALAGCADDADTATDSDGASAQSAVLNDADVRFAQDMIPHHEQAVRMAQMAEDNAESPDVLQLAAEIEAAQGPEIETMTGWLEDWGQEVPEDMTGTDGMTHGGTSMDEMPGMMTVEELDQLGALSGVDFDRMFLTMMIEHHEGAIAMARTEQDDGANPEALALAETIEAAQTAEIERMRELLNS